MNNSTSQVKDVVSTFDYLILLQKSSPHLRNYLYSLVVFNFTSSILAAVLNFLIILTFVKTSSLRTPSYILILSLAFSDLGVGVVTQPAYCCRLIAWLTKNSSLYKNSLNVYWGTAYVLITDSFLTVTAITVDRFLAVHLLLRYQELVTTKRSYIVVIIIWVASLSWCLLIVLATNANWPYISFHSLALAIVILDISLMLKISRMIRRHSAQIQAQSQPQQPTMNMTRYKKSVKTMYYIMGIFLVCFLPSVIIILVYYWQMANRVNKEIELSYALHLADYTCYDEQCVESINILLENRRNT